MEKYIGCDAHARYSIFVSMDEAGRVHARKLPLPCASRHRNGARFALQRGPILRPVAGSVSYPRRSPRFRFKIILDSGRALIDD
jgi:hypothetical protein